MPDIHIIPSGDRWNVKQENGDVVSAHDTQAEAEKAGKDWTRANGGGEVFTHRDEGEFSRIRKGDQLSDMVNLTRAKDAAISWARLPHGVEHTHWDGDMTPPGAGVAR